MAATTMKVPLLLPEGATYDDYLARPPAPNVEATVPLNFSSGFSDSAAEDAAKAAHRQARAAEQPAAEPASSHAAYDAQPLPPSERLGDLPSEASIANGSQHSGKGSMRRRRPRLPGRNRTSSSGTGSDSGLAAEHVNGRDHLATDTPKDNIVRTRVDGTGRKLKARLWLANKVPINQRQLLPLLDIMSTQNHYIGKVRRATVERRAFMAEPLWMHVCTSAAVLSWGPGRDGPCNALVTIQERAAQSCATV